MSESLHCSPGINLISDAGSASLLAESVGRVQAMEAMLLTGKIDLRQARKWGRNFYLRNTNGCH
jgi:enoyl-CoA hydratase/carnithine racemase